MGVIFISRSPRVPRGKQASFHIFFRPQSLPTSSTLCCGGSLLGVERHRAPALDVGIAFYSLAPEEGNLSALQRGEKKREKENEKVSCSSKIMVMHEVT